MVYKVQPSLVLTQAETSTSTPENGHNEHSPPFSLPEQRFTSSWTFEEQTQALGQKQAKRRTRKSQTGVKKAAKGQVKISPCRPSPSKSAVLSTPRVMRDERTRVVMETPSVWGDVALVVFLIVAVAALVWIVYEGVDRFWNA